MKPKIPWLLIALVIVLGSAAGLVIAGGPSAGATFAPATPASGVPARVAAQASPTPAPSFGPITAPGYTPGPLHTALPPTLTTPPCYAVVTAAELSVYAAPDTSARVVRTASQGERLEVSGVTAGSDGGQWARVADGWIALEDEGTAAARLADLRACDIIAGSQPATTLFGLHLLDDFTGDAVLAFVRRMAESGHPVGTLKGLNSTEELLNEAKRISPETTIIFRSVVNDGVYEDCPSDSGDPAAAARRWLDGLVPFWDDVDADYYEIVNECFADPGWMAQFSIAAMKIAGEQGRCLLLFSFGPGYPAFETFDELLPAYQYAAEHPCQPGRTHGIAMHAYSMVGDTPLSEGDKWLVLRHRIVEDRLLQDLPEAASLPVYITEARIGQGDATPDCDALARDVTQYSYELEQDPYVKGFALFNFGPGPLWPDFSSCLPEIGDALLAYYTSD